MKTIAKLLVITMLTSIIYSCVDNKYNSNSIKETSKQVVREFDDSVFVKLEKSYDTIHEDTITTEFRFYVRKFQFIEKVGLKNKKYVTIPRIALYGGDKENRLVADIRFMPENDSLIEAPFMRNDSVFMVEYHINHLPEIIGILDNHDDVIFQFKVWSITGAWADLHYEKSINRSK